MAVAAAYLAATGRRRGAVTVDVLGGSVDVTVWNGESTLTGPAVLVAPATIDAVSGTGTDRRSHWNDRGAVAVVMDAVGARRRRAPVMPVAVVGLDRIWHSLPDTEKNVGHSWHAWTHMTFIRYCSGRPSPGESHRRRLTAD